MDAHEPTVSVLLAVKDGAAYLTEALNSIRAQSMPDFEVIAVDDGSSDDTGNILATLSRADARFRVIRLRDSVGLPAALNIAIREARGAFLARHDADDISLPDRFARQLAEFADRPALGLLGTSGYSFGDTGERTAIPCAEAHDDIVRAVASGEKVFPYFHGSWMLRRACVAAVGEYNELFFGVEDKDYLLRVSEQFEVANLAAPLYLYRVHEGSVTSRTIRKRRVIRALALKLYAQRAAGRTDLLGLRRGSRFLNASIAPRTRACTQALLAKIGNGRSALLRQLLRTLPYGHDPFIRALCGEVVQLATRR